MKNPTLTFRRVRGRIIPIHLDAKGMGTPLTAAKKASYLAAQKTLKFKAIAKTNHLISKFRSPTLLELGALAGLAGVGAYSLMRRKKNGK